MTDGLGPHGRESPRDWRLERAKRWPALILLAALSTVFLFGEHRGYFYWDYDWVSSQNMAIAANLAPDHGFVGFIRRTLDGAGKAAYDLYNRFPVGTYAALALAMLPFQGDLSAQIFVAKTLTVGFFCAAAATAWLALCRLLPDRWSAAAAVLLAFSSFPMLYHADMAGEGFADVFGVMLAFHGMIVFVQEGRFRQLAIKTCIALALGWHTVALVAPFVLFGLAAGPIRSVRKSGVARAYIPSFERVRKSMDTGAAPMNARRHDVISTRIQLGWSRCFPWVRRRLAGMSAERATKMPARRRRTQGRISFDFFTRSFRGIAENAYARYGAFSLVVSIVLLSFNFAGEYYALDGEKAVTEIPSIESMGRRFGASEGYDHRRMDEILRSFDRTFRRIDLMAYPYAFLDRPAGAALNVSPEPPFGGRLAGFLAICACLAGLIFVARRRTERPALAALALCGFFWVVIAPFTVLHAFEAIFLVGVLLVGWSAALYRLRRLAGVRGAAAAAVLAAAVFGVSCFDMSRDADPARHAETPRGFGETRAVGHDEESVRFLRALPDDFDAIREAMPKGATVYLATPNRSDLRTEAFGARYAVDFYLSGYVLTDNPAARDAADFVLTTERVESPALLTPRNSSVFLYDSALFDGNG